MSFLHIDMTQVVKILPQVKQELTYSTYRKISNIRRVKYQNLNVSRLGLQLFLRNVLKPGVKWSMKM